MMNKRSGEKMKLVFYLPGLVDGGAERVMANLANWFAVLGHDVTVVVDFLSKNNGPSLHPSVQFAQLSKKHFSSIQQLAKVLIDANPDIAMSAIASANFKLVAASLLARARSLSKPNASKTIPKLVLTYHGFEEYKTGKLSWLGYQNLPLMSRQAGAIVAVSNCLKDVLASRWKARDDKLLRIYNPVSIPPMPKEFDPTKLANRENIVLCVGRLVAEKRFDLLIRAFARLSVPSSRLLIVGEGPEHSNLQQLIAKLGLSQSIELRGYVENTGALYAKAKCLVLTSKTESFGLVLVEALAYGLPIIATDCGGPREVLDHGRFGTLLRQDPTEDEIAKAISQALTNPGDPLPRIERAKDFDMETGARQYLQLFEKILREGK